MSECDIVKGIFGKRCIMKFPELINGTVTDIDELFVNVSDDVSVTDSLYPEMFTIHHLFKKSKINMDEINLTELVAENGKVNFSFSTSSKNLKMIKEYLDEKDMLNYHKEIWFGFNFKISDKKCNINLSRLTK
jgi:hypothetical protein